MKTDLNRRNFLSLSASALGAAALGGCNAGQPAAQNAAKTAANSGKPNVVIIFCDDLAYADVG